MKPRRGLSRENLSNALAWSGLFIGLAGAVPAIFQRQTNTLFWVLLVCGVGIVGFSLAFRMVESIFEWIVGKVLGGDVVVIGRCSDDHIRDVHRLARDFFGDAVTTPEKIREITSKYPDGLRVALGKDRYGDLHVRGYFFLVPISRRSVEQIKTFTFQVSSLAGEDVASSPARGYAIYIGGIAARGLIVQAEMLGALKASSNLALQTRSKTAYARAATKRGRDILISNGFLPVHAHADGVGCFFARDYSAG